MKKNKNKLPFAFLLAFTINIYVCTFCYADKGIFNPKVNPDEILTTAMPATITVFAEIGDVPMNDIKVSINETTKEGLILMHLCEMNLDIPRGLFSGHFTLNQNHKSIVYFKIYANYNSQKSFESSILKVEIYEPLPEGIIDELNRDLTKLEHKFKKYLKKHNLYTARQLVLNDAKNNPNIKETNLNGRNLSILYKGNVSAIIFLDDPKAGPLK